MSKPTTKYKIDCARAAALGLSALLLAACTEGTSDLEAWAESVKSSPQKGIEPLPEVIPYKSFLYTRSDQRDPFDDSIFRPKIGKKAPKHFSSLSPDANRVPEYLESFPLDTLRMVGTMQQNDQIWALIKTPDNTIQRVLGGNYLGQNNGKVISIADDKVKLAEIVPDGFGGWQERSSSIALTE